VCRSFSFNVGVEIGQLAVVLVVASALAAVRRRSERLGMRVAFAGSLVVIVAGTLLVRAARVLPTGA
jgi:hypothetical protein